MVAVQVFQSNQNLSPKRLREDIAEDPAAFFPDFREWLNVSFLYNDEDELAFFAKNNWLCLLKIIDHQETLSVDFVLEDYLRFHDRWQRYLQKQKKRLGKDAVSIKLILLSSHFTESFLEKISFIRSIPVALMQLRGIQEVSGKVSYLLEEPHGKADAQGFLSESVGEERFEAFGRGQLDKSELAEIKNAFTDAIPLKVPLSTVSGQQVVRPSPQDEVPDGGEDEPTALAGISFFKEAQLTEEEEKAFDRLHQELEKLSST